jgi:hypothetical protein
LADPFLLSSWSEEKQKENGCVFFAPIFFEQEIMGVNLIMGMNLIMGVNLIMGMMGMMGMNLMMGMMEMMAIDLHLQDIPNHHKTLERIKTSPID